MSMFELTLQIECRFCSQVTQLTGREARQALRRLVEQPKVFPHFPPLTGCRICLEASEPPDSDPDDELLQLNPVEDL